MDQFSSQPHPATDSGTLMEGRSGCPSAFLGVATIRTVKTKATTTSIYEDLICAISFIYTILTCPQLWGSYCCHHTLWKLRVKAWDDLPLVTWLGLEPRRGRLRRLRVTAAHFGCHLPCAGFFSQRRAVAPRGDWHYHFLLPSLSCRHSPPCTLGFCRWNPGSETQIWRVKPISLSFTHCGFRTPGDYLLFRWCPCSLQKHRLKRVPKKILRVCVCYAFCCFHSMQNLWALKKSAPAAGFLQCFQLPVPRDAEVSLPNQRIFRTNTPWNICKIMW